MTSDGDHVAGSATIIVTAADRNYFQFAQDLIRSVLVHAGSTVALGFLDLGLAADQRTWLVSRGVYVRPPHSPLRPRLPDDAALGKMRYLARPFLRENFPGYGTYAWLDADTWLQDCSALDALITGACATGGAMVRQDERAYRFWLWQICWIHKHSVLVYGALRGMWLASQPMINNGVFALAVNAPHWERWHCHYDSALGRTGLAVPHDQFGLNAAAYFDRLATAFLPATAGSVTSQRRCGTTTLASYAYPICPSIRSPSSVSRDRPRETRSMSAVHAVATFVASSGTGHPKITAKRCHLR